MDKTGPTHVTREFVVFRLEDVYFAFDIDVVAEVLPFTPPVRMPRAPKFLAGVIDVRGHMLPVVDLRLRAEVDASATPRHVLAVRLGERYIGAVVDEVREVFEADDENVGSVELLGDRLSPQFVTRVLRWGRRLVPVMNAELLLTTGEALKLKRMRSPKRRFGEPPEDKS